MSNPIIKKKIHLTVPHGKFYNAQFSEKDSKTSSNARSWKTAVPFIKQLPLSLNPPSWDSANHISPLLAGILLESVNRWHRGRLEVWRRDEDMLFPVPFYSYQHHLCKSPSGCGTCSDSKLWSFYFSGTPEPTLAPATNTSFSNVWISAP